MPTEVTTRLLYSLVAGDGEAEAPLVDAVYDELRAIAGGLVARQPRATLQPTELIHEAWMRLVDPGEDGERWEGRRHFRRVAARAMRYVLVDRARARRSAKRGGSRLRVTLDEDVVMGGASDADTTLAVSEGLDELSRVDPELARLVELRFFGGCTMEEVAEQLDMSLRSAHRAWRLARAWWLQKYGEGGSDQVS